VRDGDTIEVGGLLIRRGVWQRGKEPGEGLLPSPVHQPRWSRCSSQLGGNGRSSLSRISD
jgi:hypothetical protein